MQKKSQNHGDKMSEIDDHIMKRFEIKKRLGKGAYGIVWKAIDKKTGQTIAVKKIFDAFRNQTDSQRTFREIMFLQSFRKHPNIIQLHSIHRAANNRDIYLGFEYMDTDLHVVIKRGNILRDCHKRYIMYQLLCATKYIHSGNVIHRDQKPSNVLLDQRCRCKVADFGLARSLTSTGNSDGDSDPNLTDYVATRWYRAPEILIASKRYTKGIDMWSLGCILGEMIVGKPIFPGSSTVNQVEKIMSTIPVPSTEDITSVCSGLGYSMIKNSSVGSRLSFRNILGKDCSDDAFDLISKLLLFNPNKRLTADQALEHCYVAIYRNKNAEITINKNVVPPLDDDVRLSVDDYRNKLYELMSHNPVHQSKSIPLWKHSKSHSEPATKEIVKTRTSPNLIRNIPKPTTKDKNHSAKSDLVKRHYGSPSEIKPEPKIKPNILFKSESKIPTINKPYLIPPQKIASYHKYSVGDSIKINHLTSTTTKVEDKSKKVTSYKSVYSSPYNSYSHNHGIITASALRELKSGVR